MAIFTACFWPIWKICSSIWMIFPRVEVENSKRQNALNHGMRWNAVDGRDPAPVDMLNIPSFTRFYTSQVVVWDFWTINSIHWDGGKAPPDVAQTFVLWGSYSKKRKATIRKFSNEGIRCMVICHIEMCIFNLYRKIGASNLSDIFMLNPPNHIKRFDKKAISTIPIS